MQISDVDTPAVLIDMDKVERNLARAQAYADEHGLSLRPHVKTHKLPRMAKLQMELGAIGITCQKLSEAEAMADAGLSDIFLPYNLLGPAKLARLADLHARVTLSVTADSLHTIDGYAGAIPPGNPLKVLVECDTGARRCGVQSAEEAVTLARAIDAAPTLAFGGLMTYPPKSGEAETQAWLSHARDALTKAGLEPPVISTGGTPGLYRAANVECANEYRPGTYIYSDRMQVVWGHGPLEDCALSVRARVVSRPTPERAVLDAGSKALAADPVPAPAKGHGALMEYPDAVIEALSEEHGVVDLSACADKPEIGECVRVIPNHACVVSNLFDRVHLVRGEAVETVETVASRGMLT